MKKILFISVLVILPFQAGFSQKAPVVFGKINQEDVAMKVYEPDTSAAAVILCDYGWFDKENFDFTRTLRVKILKKAGYSIADFRYLSMERPAVKGVTYNLVGNEVVKEKLKSESIFVKALANGAFETSVAMPGIKEGCVFDIEVRFSGLPYEWAFQSQVPVKHSELCLPYSQYIEYSKNFFGYTPLTTSTNENWIAKNVPAFKSEPYINSSENYISKFEIEIRRITFPGYYKEYTATWESVNTNLLASMRFPAEGMTSLCLSSVIDKLRDSGKKEDELIKAAFEAAKKVNFNGENSIYVSEEGLCSHFKLGSGNSADVNFTLYQILKKLDFTVYPVVLSTRSNGLLSQFNPSRYKLNYIIVAVKRADGTMLLDATEKYMPCNLLPERVINGNARIVSHDKSDWIPVATKAKKTTSFQYDLVLNDDMTLTGTLTEVYTDYAAWALRDKYATFNSKDEYARQIEKDCPGLIINDITLSDIEDIYKPVTVTMNVTLEGLATQVDNEIYITPMFFEQVKESPFNAAERVYPVSFTKLTDNNVNVKIKLPENLTVSALPKPLTSKTRSNSAAFTYAVSSVENVVEAKYQFNINALTIDVAQYKELRSIYNNLVSKHGEPIILKTK